MQGPARGFRAPARALPERAQPAGVGGLPSALADLDRLLAAPPLVMLDFDGVLSPIAPRPEHAVLPPETREVLRRLSTGCPVAIVSGRDRDDVVDRVDLPRIHYVGNHGIEWTTHGPDTHLATMLDAAYDALRDAVQSVEGALVERKRFSLAVHHRLVAPAARPVLIAAVTRIADRCSGTFRLVHGNRVLELRPNGAPDKGTAVAALMLRFGSGRRPLYIGDDTTDEDAFRAVRPSGAGILVAAEARATAATHLLRDPQEVRSFLAHMDQRLRRGSRGSGRCRRPTV